MSAVVLSRKWLLTVLVGVLLALVQGCASAAYQQAKRADSADAYRAFLRDYPKDGNAEPAAARLAQLEFEQARKLHTVLAYKRYLEEFPDAAPAAAARALLEGLRFNAARERGTAAALRQFLKEHPDGAQRDEARRLLAEAELKEVLALGDPAALARAVSEHPNDPRREAAEARVDDKVFADALASGALRLMRYLNDYPAGAHREEARRRLFSLKLDGLMFSGLLDEARAEAQRSPLAKELPDLQARLARAAAEQALAKDRQPLVQAALPGNYLRSVEELDKALGSPDPLDRWEAAEELAQHVTVKALEPLLRALRTARNPLVRQRAFESLRAVLRALPRPVAEYEIATRLDQLRANDASPEVSLAVAALLDLSGRLDEAAAEYQKAYDSRLPDPLILHRWTEIRLERRQPFSAAVAARQLALWARGVTQELELPAQGTLPLTTARQVCAAAQEARYAEAVIAAARKEPSEFPDDLAEFDRDAREARKLADARLVDAELLLETQDPHALRCSDRRVASRLAAAVADRRQALDALPRKLPRLAPQLLRMASEKDPSFELRDQAAALLRGFVPASPSAP